MIEVIWNLITGGIGPYLAAAGAAIAAALGLYLKGRSDAKAKDKVRDLTRRTETMETSKEVRDAVDAKTDAARRNDLGKWVRPDSE